MVFKGIKILKALPFLLLGVLGITVGCGAQSQDVEIEEKVLIVANGADATSLDPILVNDGYSALVNTQIYETLVTRDLDMNIEPGLATSWEQIDELTYEFYLKENVYFHNGEPFTAADVKFTLLRALDSAVAFSILGEIDPETIEVVDEHTIRIGTREPFAPILANLGHSTAFIVNEKAVTDLGDDYGQNPVGTGPFMFENWDFGSRIELVKNNEYHREIPLIAGIQFQVISEASSRLIELETGQIDIAFNVSPNDVPRIEDHDELTLLRRINLATTYIGLNVQAEPFNDVRVRQAMNYAVNTELIIDTILEGVGAPAIGPMGSNIPGSATDLEGYDYNPERAMELLAEAGFEDGFTATVWVDDDSTRIDIATALAAQLREVGVDINIQILEWAAFLDYVSEGNHDMFIMGLTTVTGDPDYALYPLFHSSQHGAAGNRTFFTNNQVDELLELARQVFDDEERAVYYRELQKLIIEEAPWIFLNEGEALIATRSNVHGYEIRLNGQQKLHDVYFK